MARMLLESTARLGDTRSRRHRGSPSDKKPATRINASNKNNSGQTENVMTARIPAKIA